MKIKKIDEELIIIAGVVILGIIIVVGIATQTFKFSDTVSVFSVVVAALALYYTKRVRGPEFNLTEARIDARQEKFRRVKALIQNIGDRMGCMRWESIKIKLGEEIFHILDNRDKEWEWQAQPETQTFKGFTFNVSSDVDLTGAIFLAKGVYSSHKGKMIEKIWEIPLIGMLKPMEGE